MHATQSDYSNKRKQIMSLKLGFICTDCTQDTERNLLQGWTNRGCQIARATRFCMTICVNHQYGTFFMSPLWRLKFWRICAPLVYRILLMMAIEAEPVYLPSYIPPSQVYSNKPKAPVDSNDLPAYHRSSEQPGFVTEGYYKKG
jgi:hypothetical protein